MEYGKCFCHMVHKTPTAAMYNDARSPEPAGHGNLREQANIATDVREGSTQRTNSYHHDADEGTTILCKLYTSVMAAIAAAKSSRRSNSFADSSYQRNFRVFAATEGFQCLAMLLPPVVSKLDKVFGLQTCNIFWRND